MAKNIIICSDGTGNSAIKGRGTNVFKLFEAVDLNGHRADATLDPQIAFYDDGVGTEDWKPLRILGGAVGVGLARNVQQLYRELARTYDPGDRIFLFGFSRGAFTVRTLAGMIAACGILAGAELPSARELKRAVKKTYSAYRNGYQNGALLTRFMGWVLRWPDRDKAVEELHKRYPFHPPDRLHRGKIDEVREGRPRAVGKGDQQDHATDQDRGVRITFIGVWDTVDAVGMPFALTAVVNRVIYQFKFPTQDLSPCVDHACHALSIDDERKSFSPTLWTEPPGGDSNIEQVWFAGVHSNVGGGYPKQGMSLVALDWMLRRARALGALRLQSLDLALFEGHASVDDKLYDPRAGTGVFYRWAPRDIAKLCADHNVTPTLHLSALERVAHGTDDYAPGNLPRGAKVVITPILDPAGDEPAARRANAPALARADAVENVLRQMPGPGPNLLGEVRHYMALGEISYWLFMASWAVLLVGLIGVVVQTPDDETPSIPGMLKSVLTLLGNVVFLQMGELWRTFRALLDSPWGGTVVVAAIGFLLAWRLSASADKHMSAAFSGFWHHHQAVLRAALKGARGEVAKR